MQGRRHDRRRRRRPDHGHERRGDQGPVDRGRRSRVARLGRHPGVRARGRRRPSRRTSSSRGRAPTSRAARSARRTTRSAAVTITADSTGTVDALVLGRRRLGLLRRHHRASASRSASRSRATSSAGTPTRPRPTTTSRPTGRRRWSTATAVKIAGGVRAGDVYSYSGDASSARRTTTSRRDDRRRDPRRHPRQAHERRQGLPLRTRLRLHSSQTTAAATPLLAGQLVLDVTTGRVYRYTGATVPGPVDLSTLVFTGPTWAAQPMPAHDYVSTETTAADDPLTTGERVLVLLDRPRLPLQGHHRPAGPRRPVCPDADGHDEVAAGRGPGLRLPLDRLDGRRGRSPRAPACST